EGPSTPAVPEPREEEVATSADGRRAVAQGLEELKAGSSDELQFSSLGIEDAGAKQLSQVLVSSASSL
ncbi:unnamed protein product, partial [Polarella glacialis]